MSIPGQESRQPTLTPPNKAATRELLLLHGLFYFFGGAWPVYMEGALPGKPHMQNFSK